MKKIAALHTLFKKFLGFKQECPTQTQTGRDACRAASRRLSRQEDGFTIVEILVALIIISILMGAVGFTYFSNVGKARIVAAKGQIKAFEAALTQFGLDCDRFPTTSEGLAVLNSAPSDAGEKWKGPYLGGRVPKDPWGNEYVYMSPASDNIQQWEVRSYGRDGANGGSGEDADIVSWDMGQQ